MVEIEKIRKLFISGINPEEILAGVRNSVNSAASSEEWIIADYRSKWLALLGEAFAVADQPVEAARVWQESLNAQWSISTLNHWISILNKYFYLSKLNIIVLKQELKKGPIKNIKNAAFAKVCNELLTIGRTHNPINMREVVLRFLTTVLPYSPQIHTELGAFLTTINLTKAAASSFKKALDLSPDNPQYLSNMASALDRLGLHEKSLIFAEKALEKNRI